MHNLYLVYADIEYKGFIINSFTSINEAKITADKIWQFGNPPSPYSLHDLTEIFSQKSIAKYELDEDHLFYEKALTEQSNGFYTVGIAELNENFTLEDYLKSRNPI